MGLIPNRKKRKQIINQFIKNPTLIHFKEVNENLDEFKVDFQDLITDISINSKVFQIFKLKKGYEITYIKKEKKLYHIKGDFVKYKICKRDIENFTSFTKSLEFDNQENYVNQDKTIELVFDKRLQLLESAFFSNK